MLDLNAKIRRELGKKLKKFRKQGQLPGIVYGYQISPQPLWLEYRIFEKVFEEAGSGSLINLRVENFKEGGERIPVLIYHTLQDPISGKFVHVDFYKVRLDEEIKVDIPLVFEGEAPAVEIGGGTLIKDAHTLEIRGYPDKLPREIKVDISRLETFEDVIRVKDLNLPEGIEAERDPEDVLVSVASPISEKELEEIEEAPEEKVEEVKVEGEEKKEEEELKKEEIQKEE